MATMVDLQNAHAEALARQKQLESKVASFCRDFADDFAAHFQVQARAARCTDTPVERLKPDGASHVFFRREGNRCLTSVLFTVDSTTFAEPIMLVYDPSANGLRATVGQHGEGQFDLRHGNKQVAEQVSDLAMQYLKRVGVIEPLVVL